MERIEIMKEIAFVKEYINKKTADGTLTEEESKVAWNKYFELETMLRK